MDVRHSYCLYFMTLLLVLLLPMSASAFDIPSPVPYPFDVGSKPAIGKISAIPAKVAMGTSIRLKADIDGDSTSVTKRWTLTNPSTGGIRTFFTNDIDVLMYEQGAYDVRLEVWSPAGKDVKDLRGACLVGAPAGQVYYVGPGGDVPDMGALAVDLAAKGKSLAYGDVVALKEGHDFGGMLNLTQAVFAPANPEADASKWVVFTLWHGDRKLGPANAATPQRPRFSVSASGQTAVAFNLQQNCARMAFVDLELRNPNRFNAPALGVIAADVWWENCVFDGDWPVGSDGKGSGTQRFFQRYAPGNTRFSKVAFVRNVFRNILADAEDTSLIVLALNNDRAGNSIASGVWFVGNTLSNLRSLRAYRLYVVGVDHADVQEAYFRNVVLAANTFDGSAFMGAGASICNMPAGENYIGFNTMTNLRYSGSDPFNRIIGIWAGQFWNGIVEFNEGNGLTPTTGKDSIDNALLYPTDKGGDEHSGVIIGGKRHPYISNNVHVRWNTLRNSSNGTIALSPGAGRGLKTFGGDIAFGYAGMAICCQQRDVYYYGNTMVDNGVGIAVAGEFQGKSWLYGNRVEGGAIGLHWQAMDTEPGQVMLVGNSFSKTLFPVAVADGWPGNKVTAPAMEDYNRYESARQPCLQKSGKHRSFQSWPAGANTRFTTGASALQASGGACAEAAPKNGAFTFTGAPELMRNLGAQ